MRARHDVAETEARHDQRCEGLDVGAHDEDVARFESGIVGEHTEQYLPQHVDLPRGTVAAVHLNRPIGAVERTTLRANGVRGDIGLQPAEQCRRTIGRAEKRVRCRGGRQCALQFTQIAAQRREQRVTDGAVRRVGAPRHRPVASPQRHPQIVAGVRQPQVQLVVRAERVQQFDLGERQSGVTEQRQPARQVGGGVPQPRNGFGVPDGRRVGVDPSQQRAVELRLPPQVRVERVGAAFGPVDQQLRALAGVGGEQAGDPAGDGVAAALTQLPLLALLGVAEVRGERRAPRLVQRAVDDVEQRPDHGVGRPGVVVGGVGQFGDQRARVAERDAGAHSVLTVAAAQDVGEPLTQPALGAARRDQHEVLGERVGGWNGQHRAQAVGEEVGAIGPMEV
ncbi:hypothetical protein MCHUDSM44219_00810 [Mycolicibacterium chubuense]|uniref:Uncharacterized protein n=1 Tax=Mycolicibacterium chubuense TaxID=1800 RepID=A0A0J6WQ23_MYCCU|nr:hypothetical protein MCHUDSM44219_00810 [Mycolicibacterium chubuense]